MSSIASSNDGRSDWSDRLQASNSKPTTVPAIVSELAQRFHALRLQYGRWLVLIAVAVGLTSVMSAWMLLAVCDYWLELAGWFRQVCVAVGGCVAGAAIVWALWLVVQHCSPRVFAMRMESRFESMGQRLRTVLDVDRGQLSAPEAMLTALGHQTMARWETSGPNQVLPRRLLVLSLSALVFTAMAFIACAMAGPEMRIAMLRAVGLERAYTTLLVTPGDFQVLEGLQPEVQLELRGRPDRQVILFYRAHDASDWIESELKGKAVDNNPNAWRFNAKLDKVTSDLQYQFNTSVGASPVYTIKMQPKIVLVDSSATVLPPAYTQLPQRTFGIDEVTVLAGSKVTIALHTNRPLKTYRLMIGQGTDQLAEATLPLEQSGSTCIFNLPSDQPLRWQFTGNGEDGAPLPAVNGKLRIRHDEQPRLDWQSPVDELKVNMLAEVPMSVLISDDYGLTHAGIVFELGDNEEFVLKEWKLAEKAENGEGLTGEGKVNMVTTRLRLDEILPLESFALSEQDFISYFAFADDNRQDGHQHAESEVRYLDIRPLKQYFSEAETPPAGGGGRSFPALQELISRERYLYNRTRSLSRHYDAANKDQLRTLERMVETQSELANYTRFLIDFLVSQGNDNNEALGQAESVMLQASDALAAADFETATLRELDAIRLLVEAKNTAEISLSKNNNPQMRSQLNNFQRQLVNRLRRKTKPADTKIADDIKQIAADQTVLATKVATWLKQPSTSPAESPANKVDDPPTGEAASQSTTLSPEEQLKASQQELLDRLTAIQSDLNESIKQSSLGTERLAASVLKMDGLTGSSAKGRWDEYLPAAATLAQELMELGEHLSALAATEPARRIASLRDLTASLANQEAELATSVEQSQQADLQTPGTDKRSEQVAKRAQWIIGRTQTIEDILKLPLDSGDLRTSEIVDQLEKLIAQQTFRERLTASAQAARNHVEQSKHENWSITTRDRAREHAVMAELLDQLHRQLVAPRVELLRRLENQANQVAQALGACLSSATGKGGQSDASSDLPSPKSSGGTKTAEEENERGLRDMQLQLQTQLQNAGLTELAELMDISQNNQGKQPGNEQPGAAGGDSSGTGRAMAGGAGPFSYDRLARGHRNAMLIRQKLQALLQELVLLETTIDRNAPIPAEFKQLVDAYYRALAGEQ